MTTLNNNSDHAGLIPSLFKVTFLKVTLIKVAMASSIAMVSAMAYADQSLTAMSVAEAASGVTQLRLDFDGEPNVPEAYQVDNPSRLILDFGGVKNELPLRHHKINQGVIEQVTALDGDDTTRLIIDLSQQDSNEFTTLVEGNSLLINIAGDGSLIEPYLTGANVVGVNNLSANNLGTNNLGTNNLGADMSIAPNNTLVQTPMAIDTPSATDVVTMSQPYTASPVADQVTAARPSYEPSSQSKNNMVVRVNPLLNPNFAAQSQQYKYHGLADVIYTPTNDGGGKINLMVANPDIPIDIQRQGNKILVRLTGVTVPPNLVRRHNISGGLVTSINTLNNGRNGVVSIDMQDDFEYQAYQSGNEINIDVKPPALLREPTLEEKVYSGEPISVDFQDVEIRSVLHLLSQFTNVNIVAADNVAGNITLNLINVPWDQALDIILKSKNLGMRTNGNVILVAPAEELAQQEQKELEQQQKVQEYLPLRTEYIRLSYAKAEDVLSLISAGQNTGINNDRFNGSLLSERGTVTVDQRTNTLIIKDIAASIQNVRDLITKIDVSVPQVMIEARIVSATDSFSKELGVKWGILSNGTATNDSLLVGGSDQTLFDLKNYTIETLDNGQSQVEYTINRPDNLNVDLGVANPAGRIAFGLLSMSDVMIDLELSAMQADGRGEVISAPRILTMDKQTARVASGTQIPYQEAAASGATSTSFIEAALSLEATPNITPDGKIALELNIENGSPRVFNNAVAIAKDTLSTNIIVENGQTVVLGGIFRNQISNEVNKVPFLGDLPYMGRLFRKDVQSNEKQELLIFVTPKLLSSGASRIN